MESLAIILEPYKNVISGTAQIVTYFHSLSGAIVCNSIRKQKSTADLSLMPFLAGSLISALHLGYSLIINDFTTIVKGLVGISLNTVYLSCFIYYTNIPKDKKFARTQIGCALAFLAAVFTYTLFENPEVLRFRYGIMVSMVLAGLMIHPVIVLIKNIRDKSSKGILLPMVLPITLITFLWLLYGIIKRDNFMVLQNGFIFLLMAGQTSLYFIYPTKSVKSKEHKTKAANDSDNKKSN